VSEQAKPRKIEVQSAPHAEQQQVTTGTSDRANTSS
jgi:hypothetical protein